MSTSQALFPLKFVERVHYRYSGLNCVFCDILTLGENESMSPLCNSSNGVLLPLLIHI